MKNGKVLIIASDQPVDSDAHLRRKMANVEKRARRQAPRFPGLDLHGIQREVNRNLLKLPLFFEDRYVGLPDLMNYLKNHRRFPHITPENAEKYYLFANGFTLNGIYLYQYLLRAGYEPIVVQNYSLVDLDDLLHERPLAVCISSTFLYLDDIKEMAARVKGYDSRTPVIVGGILAKKVLDGGQNLAPQTLKWISGFSGCVDAFVVETHGEQTLLKLLEALREGGGVGGIPNLALFDGGGKLFFTERREEQVPMDSTAIEWTKIPRAYLRKTLSLLSSQGCYYRCRFCTYHRWFPKVHNKSLDVLRDELRSIRSLGFVKHVRFADDNFTANGERLKKILRMMIEEKFDFTWSAFARANAVTPEVAELMKASGCDFINMGIESGSRAILKNMDKKLDPDQTVEAIRLLRENGIFSLGGVIIGYPGETEATFHETIEMINKSGLTYFHPYLFYYSKNMLVSEEREQFGIEGVGWAWRHKTMDSVEASRLMAGMTGLLDRAFTDGEQKTWETFKLLRGEGYSSEEIYELHRLKRDLQVATADHPVREETPLVRGILDKLEARVR